MRHRHQYNSPRAQLELGEAMAEPRDARLLKAIMALRQPVLLVGLAHELSLNLLQRGLQASICDDSLERLGRLASACLEKDLVANLYWQPLAALNLPAQYESIVLAPDAWQALVEPGEALLVQQQLMAHLKADGQLRLLLDQPTRLKSLVV